MLSPLPSRWPSVLVAALFLAPGGVHAGSHTESSTAAASRPAEPPPPPAAKATPPPKAPPARPKMMAPAKKAKPKNLHPDTPGLDRTGTPPKPPRGFTVPKESAKGGEDRPVPQFEGRESRNPTAGEVLIWVPRALLLPVHLALKYLVRWPIVKGITALEEYKLIDRTIDFFTFLDGRAGIYPTTLLDFGVRPSVGFLAYFNDMVSEGDRISLQGAFWTDDWLRLTLRDRHVIFRDNSARLLLSAELLNRPDRVFYGVGPASRDANRSFFRQETLDFNAGIEADLSDLNEIGFHVGFRDGAIRSGQEPRIESIHNDCVPTAGANRGADCLNELNEFVPDYQLFNTRLNMAFDTRNPDREYAPGSGIRLDLYGSFNYLLPSAEAKANRDTTKNLAFLTYGAQLSGFLDLTGLNHVLGLSLFTEFLDTVGDGDVPLTELLLLGGDRPMRGFLFGRLRGESAFVLTADYRYPVWSFLDATVFTSIGNTYNGTYEDFSFKRMFINYGFGFKTNSLRDSSIDILLAFGTSRLDDASVEAVDNVRFVFGFSHGF